MLVDMPYMDHMGQVSSSYHLSGFAVRLLFFGGVILGQSSHLPRKGWSVHFQAGIAHLLGQLNDAMGDLMDTHHPIPKFQMAH